MKQGKYIISANRCIAYKVWRMELEGDTSALDKAGKFVDVAVEGFFLRRPFAATSWDDKGFSIIYKEVGKGTELTVTMNTKNIDCLPLGDLSGTLLSLMLTNPLAPDFLFEGKTDKGECSFDTREVRNVIGSDIPFNEPSVAQWLKEALDEEINPIFGGVSI